MGQKNIKGFLHWDLIEPSPLESERNKKTKVINSPWAKYNMQECDITQNKFAYYVQCVKDDTHSTMNCVTLFYFGCECDLYT